MKQEIYLQIRVKSWRLIIRCELNQLSGAWKSVFRFAGNHDFILYEESVDDLLYNLEGGGQQNV